MRSLLAAIRFLTILPVPGDWGTGERDLAGSVPYFPVVGLLLGGLAGGLAYGLARAGVPPLIASAAMVLVLIGFSGGLHMDGLSDSADGFLSSRPRERILEIMKDSHVGAMGVMAIAGGMLMKFASLSSTPSARLWAAAGLMPLAGRCAMVLQMALLPYARSSGLGTVFYRDGHRLAAAWAVAVLFAAAWLAAAYAGLIAAAAAMMVAVLWCLYCRRKIGGATGDTFGAACEIVETTVAVSLACCWQMMR